MKMLTIICSQISLFTLKKINTLFQVGFSQSKDSSSKKSETDSPLKQREEPTSFWLSAFFFPQGQRSSTVSQARRELMVYFACRIFNWRASELREKTQGSC